MRITTGQYKGRQLIMPKGIRPTQDKVRKAIFDILGDVKDLSFLDLFAGSGAVGLEAASRGARELTLVEYSPGCLRAIKKNAASLKLADYNLYPQKVEGCIRILAGDKQKFDLIFFDPPYYAEIAKKILQMLAAYDILSPNGFIIIQHFKKDSLPDTLGALCLWKQARYGDTALSFYKKDKRDYVSESHIPR